MINENRQIVFRRIRGRIVPINLSKRDKSAAKNVAGGLAVSGAGVGVSLISGGTFRKMLFKAQKMTDASVENAMEIVRKQGDAIRGLRTPKGSLFEYAAKNARNAERLRFRRATLGADEALKTLRKAKRISQAASLLRGFAVPLGFAMIAGGAVHAINSVPRKKRDKVFANPALAAGSGAAAAALLPGAYKLSKDAFAAGAGGGQQTMSFASSRFKTVFPHAKAIFKGLFKGAL